MSWGLFALIVKLGFLKDSEWIQGTDLGMMDSFFWLRYTRTRTLKEVKIISHDFPTCVNILFFFLFFFSLVLWSQVDFFSHCKIFHTCKFLCQNCCNCSPDSCWVVLKIMLSHSSYLAIFPSLCYHPAHFRATVCNCTNQAPASLTANSSDNLIHTPGHLNREQLQFDVALSGVSTWVAVS